MSQKSQQIYEFRPNLPLNPVRAGTNVLVTGSGIGGTRELVLQLLTGPEAEGLVYVTTDQNGREAVEAYEQWGDSYDPERMAIVDCTQNSKESEEFNVCSVSSPSDLTGIGMQFSSLYEQLYQAGTEKVRVGLYSLAPVLMYAADFRPIYRFLHTLTGRISTADGFGICAIDPETQEKKTMGSLAQLFDGRIDVRKHDDGGYELRTSGLRDQPEGWQRFEMR